MGLDRDFLPGMSAVSAVRRRCGNFADAGTGNCPGARRATALRTGVGLRLYGLHPIRSSRHAADDAGVAAATTCWTLSIGVTLAVPGESVTDTTARADTAMYQAKHAGGNSVSTI